MKKAIIFFLTCLPILILLQGCLTTLHPFFFATDIVENNSLLLGQWNYSGSEHKGVLSIEKIPASRYNELSGDIKKNENKGYLITWKDSAGNTIAQYLAFLAKIYDHYYFDYYPAETYVQQSIAAIYKLHYVKLHTCYKITFKSNNNFEIRLFDQGLVEKLIDQRKLLIRYEQQQDPDSKKIITASTEELRGYLKKYNENENAFGDTYSCKKISL